MNIPSHERYLYKPFPGSSHSWALAQAANLRPAKLLDVGPGSGAIGRELKEHGWNELHAIEVDPKCREYVAKFYSSVSDNLSAFAGQTFDLVLLLDVLEHMPDPEQFLTQLSPLIAPSGAVLISVPNIAHWSVRLMLLFGFFEYAQRGILDRTHLQFFTYRRFLRLLNSLKGFHIESTSVSIEPAELVLPGWICNGAVWRKVCHVRKWLADRLPGLLAYQHLAVLRKDA